MRASMRMTALAVLLYWAAVPVRAQTAWRTYAPAGGRLSILVPFDPEVLPVDHSSENGVGYETHLFRFQNSGVVYVFGWTQYDRQVNVEKSLDMDRDAFLKGLNARLVLDTKISSRGGMSGREYIGERGGDFMMGRDFHDGSRAYIAGVVALAGRDDARNITRFLFSLQPGLP